MSLSSSYTWTTNRAANAYCTAILGKFFHRKQHYRFNDNEALLKDGKERFLLSRHRYTGWARSERQSSGIFSLWSSRHIAWAETCRAPARTLLFYRLGHRLDNRGTAFRFLVGMSYASPPERPDHPCIHPACSGYRRCYLPRSTAAGKWSWPPTSICCRGRWT